MGNRVLIGNRTTGGKGYYVSKARHDVLTCARKELLFDSSQTRAGECYAGGFLSTMPNTGQTYLTTNSKSSLGYIPLVIWNERDHGESDHGSDGGDEVFFQSNISFIETNATSIIPRTLGVQIHSNISFAGAAVTGRVGYNFNFMVLKIPCAYGFMTSTYFG